MKTKTLPGFDLVAGRPLMVLHTFSVTADGQLEHRTDGNLRATVPPEGWAAYCEQYPDAQDIVDELTKPTEVKPAVPEAPATPAEPEEPSVPLATVQEMIDAAVAQAILRATQPGQP